MWVEATGAAFAVGAVLILFGSVFGVELFCRWRNNRRAEEVPWPKTWFKAEEFFKREHLELIEDEIKRLGHEAGMW